MEFLFLEGTFQIANLFLSIVAMVLVIPMLKYYQHKELRAWKYIMIALLVFDVLLIFGVLRSFEVYSNPYFTHILATVILCLLIIAQKMQIKFWMGEGST
jgi:hypothetical protein